LNAGWGWLDDNEHTVVLGGAVPDTLFFPSNGDGGFTGGQIGNNDQIGSIVIGVETDIQWSDTDQAEDVAFIPLGAPGTFDNDLSVWFGTVHARAGVAFDRVLIYATGRLAYADDNRHPRAFRFQSPP
jgi:outer membrane immunogenic protein